MSTQADQYLQSAVQQFQGGRLDDARSACARAITSDAQHATAHQLLGLIEHAAGRYSSAVDALRQSVRLVSDQAPWHFNLGVSLRAAGDTLGAIAAYRRACELDDGYAVAWHNMGTALLDLRDFDEAIEALTKSVHLDARQADWWGNLGSACVSAARGEAAVHAYEQAVALDPDDAAFHAGLGDARRSLNENAKARRAYQKALELDPTDPELMHRLGLARRDLGNAGEAERWFRAALKIMPGEPQILRSLAMVLRDSGRLDESAAAIDQALMACPDHPELVTVKASLLNRRGMEQEAAALLQPLLESGPLCINTLVEYAFVAGAVGAEQHAIDKITAVLDSPGVNDAQKSLLHFAAARLHDRLKQDDPAFDHAEQANQLRRRRLKRKKTAADFDARIDAFDPRTFAGYARSTQTAVEGGAMVFVVGMPRSGTTLVEQVIAAHPRAIGIGESPWLARIAHELPSRVGGEQPYATCLDQLTPDVCDGLAQTYLEHVIGDRKTGAGQAPERVVDKMPGNFIDVGLIALLFPQARIIHCQRDPRDVCLSCYFHHFGGSHPYAYDLSDFGFYHQQYDRLMAHWHSLLGDRILPVVYEEVTDDLEGQARRLIDHVGLKWDDACLSFHEQETTVVTSSFQQVRQPIYRSSVGKWRRYAHRLGPLLEALGMAERVATEAA